MIICPNFSDKNVLKEFNELKNWQAKLAPTISGMKIMVILLIRQKMVSHLSYFRLTVVL